MFVVLTCQLDTQADITSHLSASLKMLHSKVDYGSEAEQCERNPNFDFGWSTPLLFNFTLFHSSELTDATYYQFKSNQAIPNSNRSHEQN